MLGHGAIEIRDGLAAVHPSRSKRWRSRTTHSGRFGPRPRNRQYLPCSSGTPGPGVEVPAHGPGRRPRVEVANMVERAGRVGVSVHVREDTRLPKERGAQCRIEREGAAHRGERILVAMVIVEDVWAQRRNHVVTIE